ncbi:hypothetical protein B1A99_20855 [Cohnella sp. CIP 111063]|uniref:hypothetical protein n=1 Tax=unclassified Cohnella TaxID=2636738 RepID=UPI000B8C1D31|nr:MULTISPECIES: hypothetical protein [unclassified Cohnella]OXS56220.1 hypothetical protein B1A99_20855 [Cohnella sp. CIP 111063]PRX67855.1 hypothetical protein B0G52_11474 [Cohnella sp. SGD-V74]
MTELDEQMKKAYELLGLPEDATREQVENRYFILLKRARAEKTRSEAGEDDGETLKLAEINQAYNLIIGIESEKSVTVEKQTKVGHFFYYYKVHVIIGLLIVLVGGYMIKEGIDKRREAANTPPANLSVSVFGNFYFADAELLEQNLLKLVPEWQRIKTSLVYNPPEIQSQQDMALQQKSVLMLITEKDEVYVTDEKNFESLAMQGLFVKLDEFAAKTGLKIPDNLIRQSRTEDDTSDYAYGIDLTGHRVFDGIEMTQERQIIGIRAPEERWDDVATLLGKLLQTMR